MLEALKSLLESDAPTKFRIAPDPPIGPRIASPPETPQELPRIRVEPDVDYDLDEDQVSKWQVGIAAAVLGRGYALPGKKMDLFCDEDYFQNITIDTTQARRFVAMTRLALPLSPTITAASAYLDIALPSFMLADRLVEQIDRRLPNQMRLKVRERIPEVLRQLVRLPGINKVTVVSQVLIQTPAMAAYIDPSLKTNTAAKIDRPGGGLGRGKIALPPEILSKWSGRDATVGAAARPPTMAALAAALLGADPDARNSKYLTDALSGTDALRYALNRGPGLTVGIGVHALYHLPAGPITEQNRYGELKAVNLSRLFVVNVKSGVAPPAKSFQLAKPASIADEEIQNGEENFRYLGRIKVT